MTYALRLDFGDADRWSLDDITEAEVSPVVDPEHSAIVLASEGSGFPRALPGGHPDLIALDRLEALYALRELTLTV